MGKDLPKFEVFDVSKGIDYDFVGDGHRLAPVKSREAGIIVEAMIECHRVFFFVRNMFDWIQNLHLNGQFYEVEELAIIRRHFGAGQTFLDIGSNIGNHAIYVSKFLNPGSLILVEPNPEAISILRINLLLNGIAADNSFLGLAFGDGFSSADIEMPPNDLGAAQLTTGFALQVVRGDDCLIGRRIDFIKLDVEGLEMAVLAGLSTVIGTCKPNIFVEVNDNNLDKFLSWCSSNDYSVVERYRRYPINENYLIKWNG
jgi:FkbM family methyltransferase